MNKPNKTKVIWINRMGERREHTLFDATFKYARKWFKTAIEDCQGVLTLDEKKDSKLKLLEIQNPMI